MGSWIPACQLSGHRASLERGSCPEPPPVRGRHIRHSEERYGVLRAYNQEFLSKHSTNPELQGRIDSYELAYRMQSEVPGALDLAGESQEALEMYGMNDPVTESFGKRCLMARKLVEKGVRFIQLYTPSQSWDGHTDIIKNHTKNAAETDKPIAALIKDLKRRGLLDSTLLVWMGEFGRTPDNPADLRDVHATVMHLMGLNDMRLTFYSAGRNQRLTDTGGTVIKQVVA